MVARKREVRKREESINRWKKLRNRKKETKRMRQKGITWPKKKANGIKRNRKYSFSALNSYLTVLFHLQSQMKEDLGALSSDITTWMFWQQSKGGMRKELRSKEICQRLEDSCVSRLTLCTKAFMTFPQLTTTAFKYVSNIHKQIQKTCIHAHEQTGRKG